jgi:hypothetical protein
MCLSSKTYLYYESLLYNTDQALLCRFQSLKYIHGRELRGCMTYKSHFQHLQGQRQKIRENSGGDQKEKGERQNKHISK